MSVLRKVDARAWGAVLLVGIALLLDFDSLAREVAEEGGPESCSYYDVADMALGPIAFLLALAALVTTDVGRHRISTAAVSVVGLVGGVLVTMHGFGRIGGLCENGKGEGTMNAVIGGLLVVALVVVLVDRSKPVPPPALVVEGSDAPLYEGGVKRCRACQFSSNSFDATECRMCGSTDLVPVPYSDDATSDAGANEGP
jgi:hypothetical protein